MSANDIWWYAQHHKPCGPVSLQQLRSLLASGALNPSSLVWTEGMPAWCAAGEVQGIVVQTGRNPPPLPIVTQTPQVAMPAAAASSEPVAPDAPTNAPTFDAPAAIVAPRSIELPPADTTLPLATESCPNCGKESLVQSKTFRAGPFGVTVGFLLLVPSVLGVVAAIVVAGLEAPELMKPPSGPMPGLSRGLSLLLLGVCAVAFVIGLLGSLAGFAVLRRGPATRCASCGAVITSIANVGAP